MKKIWSVIKREYIQAVRTKGFIIATILVPVVMVAIFGIPILVSLISVGEQKTIAVIDLTQEIYEGFEKRLEGRKLKNGKRRYILEKVRPTADIDELRESLRKEVLDKKLSAYIFIPENISQGGEAQYASLHTTDFEETQNIKAALSSVVIEKRLRKEGLDPQKIGKYLQGAKLTAIKVTKKGEEKDSGGTFAYSYVLVITLYMALIFYGAAIMRGVLEEKTSRVIEVVLSSLESFQLMAGKILGIGAVGFTQFSIWAVFGIFAFRFGKSKIPMGADFNIPSVPIYVFVYFIIFFLLGFFLYSTFFAAIGSMVNSEKEAQQYQTPVVMFLVVPMLLMMLILRSPNSTIAVVLSMIPLFSPILMLMRVCVLLPPFIEVAGSIVLLMLSILFMVWLTSKIYRVGILMYGKPPKLKEIAKWVKYG